MTLTSAIEAARWSLHESRKMLIEAGFHKESGINHFTSKAIAALPDKPKSEEEIAKIIKDAWIDESNHGYPFRRDMNVLRALKSAGVLFVKED